MTRSNRQVFALPPAVIQSDSRTKLRTMKVLVVCLLLAVLVFTEAAPFQEFLDVERFDDGLMQVAKRAPFVATCIDEGSRRQCFCYYNSKGEVILQFKCN